MPHKKRLSALSRQRLFSTRASPSFYDNRFRPHVSDILDEWRAKGVFRSKPAGKVPKAKNKRHAYTYVIEPAEIEILSKPKRGYERRNIHNTSNSSSSTELRTGKALEVRPRSGSRCRPFR